MVKAAALRSTRPSKTRRDMSATAVGSGLAEILASPAMVGAAATVETGAAADGKPARAPRKGKDGAGREAVAAKAATPPAAKIDEAAAAASPQPRDTLDATRVPEAFAMPAKAAKARRKTALIDRPDAPAADDTATSSGTVAPALQGGRTGVRQSSETMNGSGATSRRKAVMPPSRKAPPARARRTATSDPTKHDAVAPASSTRVVRRNAGRPVKADKAAAAAIGSAAITLSTKRGGTTGRRSRTGPAGHVEPAAAKPSAETMVAELKGARAAKARPGATKPAPGASSGCVPIKLGFLSDFVGFHLRLAQDASYRAFARFKDKDLVKPGRFPALAIIHLNPGISQSALGRAIARDKSTVSPLIKDLQKNGLITRKPSPNDRRSVTLVLTKKGERVLDRLHVRAREHEHDLDKLVGASKGKLVALLDKITDALT